MVTGSSQGVRDLAWMQRHLADDMFVTITNVTSTYVVLSVMGPNACNLMTKLTKADLSNEAFPFGTA